MAIMTIPVITIRSVITIISVMAFGCHDLRLKITIITGDHV